MQRFDRLFSEKITEVETPGRRERKPKLLRRSFFPYPRAPPPVHVSASTVSLRSSSPTVAVPPSTPPASVQLVLSFWRVHNASSADSFGREFKNLAARVRLLRERP